MTESPFRIERTDSGIGFTFDVVAETAGRQLKKATFDKFEILCDEGAAIGGDDTAPPPLAYFGAALAFWLLTQLARVGEARKIAIDSARMTVTPSFVMAGSILAGTASHRLGAIETELEIVSEAASDDIAAAVDQAERMCFVLDALQGTHSVRRTATLNGRPLGTAG